MDASLARDVDEPGSRIDRARRTYNQQASGLFQLPVNTVHIQRNFTKPNNVRTHRFAAFRTHRQFRCSLV